MKNYIINNYQYSKFFDHYFNSNEEWLNKPEHPLLNYVIENTPEYVTTIINFGCANGRDFIPFQDRFTCIGFDLASPDTIKWACKTDNLTYYQCSVEDYLSTFNHNLDLSECLVYTQGTLMYASYETQTQLIKHLLHHGCKNLTFHEYPPECPIPDQGHNGVNPNANFNPSLEVLNIFERKHFRPVIERQPTGFLYLNK